MSESSQVEPPRHDWRRGLLLALLGVALLSAMDVLAKLLVLDGVSGVQIVALRSLIIVPLLLMALLQRGKLSSVRFTQPRLHLLRGLMGAGAPVFFFTGLTVVSLAHASVVLFSAVFLVALLSIVLLGERIGPHRWSAIVVGFLGVVLIVGHGSAEGGQLLGYVSLGVAALCYALLFVLGRLLAASESTESLVLSQNAIAGMVTLCLLPWLWVSMDLHSWGLLIGVAVLALAGHTAMVMAFKAAEASFIVSLDYTALLWALIYDRLIFDDRPSVITFIGAALIIGGSAYMGWRERKLS